MGIIESYRSISPENTDVVGPNCLANQKLGDIKQRRPLYSGPEILLILGLLLVRRRPARRSAQLLSDREAVALLLLVLAIDENNFLVTNLFVIFVRFCFRYCSNLCVCDIHRLPSSSRTRRCAVSQSPLLILQGGKAELRVSEGKGRHHESSRQKEYQEGVEGGRYFAPRRPGHHESCVSSRLQRYRGRVMAHIHA